jgi:hypothetical protein
MVEQCLDRGEANRFIWRGLAVPQGTEQGQADEQDGYGCGERPRPDGWARFAPGATSTTDEGAEGHLRQAD